MHMYRPLKLSQVSGPGEGPLPHVNSPDDEVRYLTYHHEDKGHANPLILSV
jgi:hypothetical protein